MNGPNTPAAWDRIDTGKSSARSVLLPSVRKWTGSGRNGVMPPHKDLLGDEKVHLLTAYVYSLSQK